MRKMNVDELHERGKWDEISDTSHSASKLEFSVSQSLISKDFFLFPQTSH